VIRTALTDTNFLQALVPAPTRDFSPLATPKCLTYGRVKIPHLAVAGRGMITRFDATWQGAQQIL
jgi:hypothetical protein